MSKVQFYLHRDKYVYFSYYANDGRARGSIGKTIDKELWNKGKLPKDVEQRIDRVKFILNDYINKSDLASTSTEKAEIELLVTKEINKKRTPKSNSLADNFQRYREMVLAGEILNRGNPYSDALMKQLDAIQNVYLTIRGIGDKKINSFTVNDFERFKGEMLKLKCSQNTISTYVTHLKSFLKKTFKLGWHTNKVWMNEDLHVPKEEIDYAVYLTVEEIQKVYDVPLVYTREREMRDAFVFGCYTGLRLSDLQKVDPQALSNGILAINTQKRKNTVQIPLSAIAREIWAKYGGRIPDIVDAHKLNRSIRNVCSKAGITNRVHITKTRGGEKTNEYPEKWKIVGSHTMRRSFATNAYKAGVPTLAIMKITGHKTEISFLKYIRIGNEENAEIMKGHEFFK